MAPPALMNVFLLASRGEIAHKPALIVGRLGDERRRVPGGRAPRVQFEEHAGRLHPGPRRREAARSSVLNGPEPAGDADASLRERIAYSLRVLCVYAQAFALIRKSGVIDLESYPYGM